ncbi:MAG: ABC transporter ATP-binding protein [Desulfatitalea sp.]|nr:ABC transporter ATP-binding protein [Desulfatitalea sp.]NNK02858.1 ABC transporter ATP-binding protein [Desulfatitalea sp.]
MAADDLLTIENLSLTLGSGPAQRGLVHGVSLRLKQKRIMGLIGASGCGKSLTCLAVMRLLPDGVRQTSGEIRFRGTSLGLLPEPQMRILRGSQMAMILQNPMSCFDALFTIGQHLRETLSCHRSLKRAEAKRRMQGALAAVGFDPPNEILDLFPFQLSGGMLQRVMVAIALLLRAPLIIADEATTDLDLVSQAGILDLLERLKTVHGMSILLITHDLGVVARLADEVAVMDTGRIVASGPVERVFKSTGHPYTQALRKAHLNLYGPRLHRFGIGTVDH